ncbi:hypothetical protein MAPG_05069 [Magnaporthiopsis poae ATCC 64411]|uniref:Protein kinase domain-containing protein n=1 Tax=Magnaporthiopsis poae (strain ATCC 64411 / 73-15) TaxID=644358 RepID=A0A0C4DYE8_MAGP6|nr:hypothetical protein MAPG_05069 [Magnaporthiopsis poae ATCC 64411]
MCEPGEYSSKMYEPGQLLELTAEPSRNTIVVRIHAIPHKFTLSATLVVDVVSAHESLGLPARAFLKLNDSRTAHEYRWRHQLGDYTPRAPRRAAQVFAQGQAARLPGRLPQPRGGHSAAEKEVALKEDLADELKFELDAYDALHAHQGVSIPKLYSRVSYVPGKPDIDSDDKKKKNKNNNKKEKMRLGKSPELFRHIDGFRLTDMPFHIGDLPRGRDRNVRWTAIVEQARAKVAAVFGAAADVINRDTRPENVMVVVEDDQPPADGGVEPGYSIFLVDLGCCQRRPADMSDRGWREMKTDQAEADRMKRLALDHLRPYL